MKIIRKLISVVTFLPRLKPSIQNGNLPRLKPSVQRNDMPRLKYSIQKMIIIWGLSLFILLFPDVMAGKDGDRECLAPRSNIPDIKLRYLDSDDSEILKNKRCKRLFDVLVGLFMPTEKDEIPPEIPEHLIPILIRTSVFSQFGDIIDFAFSPNLPPTEDESIEVDFSNFLKSETILDAIISQMALLGRLQPGDRFRVSKKMTDSERAVHGERKHISSQTPLDDHLDRLSGEIDYFKGNGDSERFIILTIKLLQETSRDIFFIADIQGGLPRPEDKVFIFSQTMPTDLREIYEKISNGDKLSFIDILNKFGYSAPDTESFRFERLSFFSEIEEGYTIERGGEIQYLLAEENGVIHESGILYGGEADSREERDLRMNEITVLHHVHPDNDYWLSYSDVLGSMALGLPFAITIGNGEGLFFQPKFSRVRECDLQRKFKQFAIPFRRIMSRLAKSDNPRINKKLRNEFALSFLSHFYRISKYEIPAAYYEPRVITIISGSEVSSSV